jgi:hypothetical protein
LCSCNTIDWYSRVFVRLSVWTPAILSVRMFMICLSPRRQISRYDIFLQNSFQFIVCFPNVGLYVFCSTQNAFEIGTSGIQISVEPSSLYSESLRTFTLLFSPFMLMSSLKPFTFRHGFLYQCSELFRSIVDMIGS